MLAEIRHNKICMMGILVSAFAMGLCLVSGPTWAGDAIANACLSAEAASGALCDCLQQVADQTLDSSDQRKAAKLFTNPEKAEDLRQADSGSAEEFWNRYSNFAATAETTCPAS